MIVQKYGGKRLRRRCNDGKRAILVKGLHLLYWLRIRESDYFLCTLHARSTIRKTTRNMRNVFC